MSSFIRFVRQQCGTRSSRAFQLADLNGGRAYQWASGLSLAAWGGILIRAPNHSSKTCLLFLAPEQRHSAARLSGFEEIVGYEKLLRSDHALAGIVGRGAPACRYCMVRRAGMPTYNRWLGGFTAESDIYPVI